MKELKAGDVVVFRSPSKKSDGYVFTVNVGNAEITKESQPFAPFFVYNGKITTDGFSVK